MKLREIAHSRAGDKGDTANLSVIARDPADYPLLERHVTAERVKAFLEGDPAEGLGWKAWESRFGSLTDRRFLDRAEAIRAEVLACPGFRPGGPEPDR